MEDDKNLQFPISKELIEPFIKQAVSIAITSALGDGAKLVEHAVANAMDQKVNGEGNISRSSYDNKYVFAEVVAKKKIQDIARETIHEMAEQMRPKIKEAILKQLKSKHNLIAKTLVDGIVTSLTSRWSVNIEMKGN